ncbi:molecular chaperone [Bordetella sp. BOR01]|uniref:TorD/DmsD family molecular chaperone n=1 Tax=Bordetella sp. BOR01 TaxID=2854779 RepID=UPI001C43B7D0|nr:molecular chaperone TorD family protein [Bordetella sp. BOR01]MBV7482915.1 molecular chaperone TorD family protein [Bordetella sp. BOR01]
MNATVPPADIASTGLDEDAARAEIYGLLAHLFYAPPAELLAQLCDAPAAAPGSLLEASWDALAASARELSAPAVQVEYDALFGGVGKPEVYLFGSHYLAGFLNEKPLVRLRDDLSALGLARDPAMPETEDHIAYLCVVMRLLIGGPHAQSADLVRQREFFGAHIQPWAADLCDAIVAQPSARFYARVADFTRDFVQVEAQGFDMLP